MGRPWGAGGWISPRSRLGQWMNRRWWHFYVGLGVINTLLWFWPPTLVCWAAVASIGSGHPSSVPSSSAVFSASVLNRAWPRAMQRR
jgi:hypothetical protein